MDYVGEGMARTKVIIERSRVGYDGCYYLIVPDHAAGKRNRYTTYHIPTTPGVGMDGGAIVIGRELTFSFSKKVIDIYESYRRTRREKELGEDKMGSGRLLITVDEAVRIARKHMHEWEGTKLLPEVIQVELKNDTYVIQWGNGKTVYLSAVTGQVMSPCSDILYDPHLGD